MTDRPMRPGRSPLGATWTEAMLIVALLLIAAMATSPLIVEAIRR
jgi:hypothetical protein